MRMTSEVTVTLAVLWEGEVGAGVLENTVHRQNSVGQLGCSGLRAVWGWFCLVFPCFLLVPGAAFVGGEFNS